MPTASVRSDRIRDVDEDVLDAEALGEPVAQRAHAERLRRVVAGGDEVDARARARRPSRARAARRSGTRRGRARPPRASASAAEPETMPIRRTRSGPAPEHQRLAAGHLAHAREQLLRRDAVAGEACRRGRSRGRGSRRTARGARSPARRPGSRCCRPRGGRRAAGGRRPALMSCLNSGRRRSASTGVSPVGMEVPEQPVVDEHELGVELDRALDQLALRRDAGDDAPRPPRAPGTCRPLGPRSANAPGSSSSSSAATIEVIRRHGVMRKAHVWNSLESVI